jgi:hypothetical protein
MGCLLTKWKGEQTGDGEGKSSSGGEGGLVLVVQALSAVLYHPLDELPPACPQRAPQTTALFTWTSAAMQYDSCTREEGNVNLGRGMQPVK